MKRAAASPAAEALPFWKTTPLSKMTPAQWESLCDGCGKCCLVKLRDVDTNEILFTNIACKQLDLRSCRCKDYQNRKALVPDCVQLTPRNIGRIDWLPETCAYKLVHRGEDLPWWHPLVSGDTRTVHQAGISMRRRAISEGRAGEPEDHIVDWIK
ncbi:hypothetical protein A8950_3297 [Dongia mobilis]|uniref:UPF0260 protein A8950_3297 n=1 Tax=Dongia mobilis TaxID=578943 RepID=A0A4R6WFJ3_9PROT|nr:YcgN family cysteine cluster protein [Dongia mobilis]TDQ78836.1 hypothetical protein A8950_3297 [Dongia mobilis]